MILELSSEALFPSILCAIKGLYIRTFFKTYFQNNFWQYKKL